MKYLWILILAWLAITVFSRRARHKLLALAIGLLALLAALTARANITLSDLFGGFL